MSRTKQQAQTAANVEFSQVGKPLVRTDAPGKATGITPFAGDYTMPGMLHAKVVRSRVASAKLRRLDVSKARALEGVVCVLTGADLPDSLAPTDIPGQTGQARLKTDQQILVRERVRYDGEPVALIAAETRDIAEQAMELVALDLEPVPGVYDPEEAAKPGAPIVQGTDNVVAERRIRKGDLEKGMAEAGPVLLEPVMRMQVTVPNQYTGDVIGDLNTKRAKIGGMNPMGDTTVVEAEVPQAEVLQYARSLRSLTQRRGSFTMEFDHYAEVPGHLTPRIVEESKKEPAKA